MVFSNTSLEAPFFGAVLLGNFLKLGEVSLNQKVVDVCIIEVARFIRFRSVARGEETGVVTAIVVDGFHDDVHRDAGMERVGNATGGHEEGHGEKAKDIGGSG
ncbi:MAG: hypothetical protein ACLPZF_24865 [Candidatus Acidiferrales bacterium]